MKITQTGNNIKVTTGGRNVLLAIDGGDPNVMALCKSLTEKIGRLAKKNDFTFYRALLGWDENVLGHPDFSNLDSVQLQKRGRFITPVLENNNVSHSDADLIVLSAGKIYDYGDWEHYIEQLFNQVIAFDISDALNKGEDLVNTLTQIEARLLSRLFEDSIDEIVISFEQHVIPCHIPDNFNLVFEPGERRFYLQFKRVDSKEHAFSNMDFELVCRGKPSRTMAEIRVNAYPPSRKEVNCAPYDKANIQLLNNRTKDVLAKHLSALQEQSAASFLAHCPLCNKEENFYNIFFCSSKDRYIGDEINALAIKSGKMFLYIDDDYILYPAYQRVLEYKEGKFIFVDDDGCPVRVSFNMAGSSLDYMEPVNIFKDLYRFSDNSHILIW